VPVLQRPCSTPPLTKVAIAMPVVASVKTGLRYQFSLRSLLIVVTLLAAACALAAPQYRRWERRRQEEAAIERIRVLIDKMDTQVFDGGATQGNQ
jgi:hypothetical protein